MKLDPGIHIVMHSVLSLKPGVTPSQSLDWGLGVVCWAHSTEHLWRVLVPFGETVPSGTTAESGGQYL